MLKTVTAKEIVEAIRKNGWPQHTNEPTQFIVYDMDGKVVSACAFGQGALNLEVSAARLAGDFQMWLDDIGETAPNVVQLNDNDKLTPAQIAKELENFIPDDLLGREFMFYTNSDEVFLYNV